MRGSRVRYSKPRAALPLLAPAAAPVPAEYEVPVWLAENCSTNCRRAAAAGPGVVGTSSTERCADPSLPGLPARAHRPVALPTNLQSAGSSCLFYSFCAVGAEKVHFAR